MLIHSLFALLHAIIRLVYWTIFLAAIFSILASFGVLDTRNRIVWSLGDFLYRVTEPILRPIRNILPNFGNIDLSPLVVILLLVYVVQPLIETIEQGLRTGVWTLL